MAKTDRKSASKVHHKSYFERTSVLRTVCTPNWQKKPKRTFHSHSSLGLANVYDFSPTRKGRGSCEGLHLFQQQKKTSSTQHFQTKWSQIHFLMSYKKTLQCTWLVKTDCFGFCGTLLLFLFFLQQLMWTEILPQITSTCANSTGAFVSHSFSFKSRMADMQSCFKCMS